MVEEIPADIRRDLERAGALHLRTTSDYKKCVEFNQLMADILARLEDAGCDRAASRVMTILLDCNPKEGASCDKNTLTGERVKKL